MENIKIRFKKLDRYASMPVKTDTGDWIDLSTISEIVLNQGEFYNIPLGIAIELPKGYEALVVPRSSTFMKYGILQANSVGVIDERYCGDNDEWHMPVYAVRDTVIPPLTRICQFRIFKHQPDLIFEEVKNLGNKDRGGFGSTGD